MMFSQLLYLLQGENAKGILGSINEVFYFLFSGDLEVINPYHNEDYVVPDVLENRSTLTAILMGMFLIFSIWILNIFIGAISSAYDEQVNIVEHTFRQAQAQS